MDSNLFFSLLDKYRDGTATDAEKALVEAYYRRLERAGSTELSPEEEAALKEGLYQQIIDNIRSDETKVVSIKRKTYRLVAAAAVLLIMLGAGGYFWLSNKPTPSALKQPIATVKPKDLPPGRDAAVLTLANGQKIVLDSASGTICEQGNVSVLNVNGMLSYAPVSKKEGQPEVIYNTVSTARGNQYQLVLADGTKVWLNSASSLRFPTSFTGNNREVELDGEGYFEVAKNAAKPFHVKTRSQDIEVLGTHFNVNAYRDEEDIKTTLLEGKVKVQSIPQGGSNDQSVILKPGEQASVSQTSQLSPSITVQTVDLDQVMAWKNGWFEFDDTDIKMIMRQISRWYDVDIVYETKPGNEKFGGRISRNLNLSNILKMLENYGVHFKLEGKILVVQ
jgi:ferric-dicitrate binding protein FerR (iron transport regulator)